MRLPDSNLQSPFGLYARKLTVMDVVLSLDRAGRDARVKGLYHPRRRCGHAVAEAEELDAAIERFRKTGKFVIADAQDFGSDRVLAIICSASSANEIWMQPKACSARRARARAQSSCAGFFDKIDAVPQIAKRADYKSAADMFMEKDYTAARPRTDDRLPAILVQFGGRGHRRGPQAFGMPPSTKRCEASPQFASDVRAKGLIDKIGYDDDAGNEALARAGNGAKFEPLADYARAQRCEPPITAPARSVALVEGAGEIVDGTADGGVFGGNTVIAGDDYAQAIRAGDARQDRSRRSCCAWIRPADRFRRLGADSGCDQEGAGRGQARRRQHGNACGIGRLLHLVQRRQDRRRTRHDHRLHRRAHRQGRVRQIAAACRRHRRRDRRGQERAVRFRRSRRIRTSSGRR